MISKPHHLTVRKGQSARAAAEHVANYAREEQPHGVSREGQPGYYSKADTPSRWMGEGARALGLEGEVRREDLIEVLQGHLPNGEDISSRGGRKAERRMATDLTVSVPKSVSILAIGGSDPRIEGLLWDAVEYTGKFIEKECIVARRGHGGTDVEHTGKMVCAGYQHNDARMVDGMADPDWHLHMLIMNITQRSDGTWVARDLSFGERNVLRMTADYAMKAYLAKRLQELGYKVRMTKDGFEIEGITQEQIDALSRRTGQVDAKLESQGLTRETSTTNQRDAANLGTREGKTKLGRLDHAYQVRGRIRDVGLDLDALTKEAMENGPTDRHDLNSEAVASAARHLGERESVFSKNMTRLEALKAATTNVTLDTVDAAIAANAAGLIDVGGDKLTTRDALYREQEILARARAGAGTVAALMPSAAAEAFISEQERRQGFSYTKGQREALALALTTTDRVTGVRGAWGAGKTTSMKGLTRAAHDLGVATIGLAPTTRAASELESAGTQDIRTIASWLMTKPELGADGTQIRNENRLIILDEAGMVSSEDMDRVMKKLDAEGGRLLLVGDPQQLRAVAAGTPFEQMLKTGAIRYAEVDEVQRQRDPRLREMAQVWARGDAVAAVEIAQEYMRTVAITEQDWAAAGKEAPDKSQERVGGDDIKPTDAMVRLAEETGMDAPAEATFREVREWLDAHVEKKLGFDEQRREAPEKKTTIPREVRQAAIAREAAQTYLSKDRARREDTIMMAATNRLRMAINRHVREGLKARGEVGGQEVTVRALDKSQMTHEALARAESYIRKEGDPEIIVRLQEGRGKNRREVDYKVAGVEKGRVMLEDPDGKVKSWNPATAIRPGVFTAREMAVAPGDEISFRDNVGRKGAPDRIDNGTLGKVVGIDKRGIEVALDDGRQVFLDPNKNHVMDHGWAITVHKAQGAGRGRVIYAAESIGQEAIAQLAGVACTREKDDIEIITDDTEKLSKAMGKWATHETAIAATKSQRIADLDTLKSLRAQAAEALGRAGDLSRARDLAEEPVELAQAREEERELTKRRELEQEIER